LIKRIKRIFLSAGTQLTVEDKRRMLSPLIDDLGAAVHLLEP
jgi:uncharacterized protein YcgI (DUF1989 family)